MLSAHDAKTIQTPNQSKDDIQKRQNKPRKQKSPAYDAENHNPMWAMS